MTVLQSRWPAAIARVSPRLRHFGDAPCHVGEVCALVAAATLTTAHSAVEQKRARARHPRKSGSEHESCRWTARRRAARLVSLNRPSSGSIDRLHNLRPYVRHRETEKVPCA